jgi:hypothetical protein
MSRAETAGTSPNVGSLDLLPSPVEHGPLSPWRRAAAFDPAVRSPLAAPPSHGGAIDSGDDDKILQFPLPTPASRPQRPAKPRRRRPKLQKPKKRDS